MKKSIKLLIFIFLFFQDVFASEYLYILNDECINDLFTMAQEYFKDSDVEPIKDSRGIILRYSFNDAISEYNSLNLDLYKKIEYFLAKIENSAIIEVHTCKFSFDSNIKNWEFSTLIANNIEAVITKPTGSVEQNRINSVGYGEFLPSKNTSNNGGKNLNRVDIIILCNISGE